VDKNQFISVLHHFSGSSVAEAEEVLALKKRYPYSQVLHALSAKVSRDHGFSNHQQELQLAAIYASDRSVLKEVMNAEYTLDGRPETKDPDIKLSQKTTEVAVKNIDPTAIDQRATPLGTKDLADAVLADLEQLNKSRHDFESMFEGVFIIPPQTVGSADPITEDIQKDTQEDTHDVIRSKGDEAVMQVHQQVEALASKQEKTGKSKKARIVELARALEAERMAAEKQGESSHDGDGMASSDKKTGDTLIDEIVSTKSAITPETEKQKEQIEIIDQFIKAQPSITSAKDKPQVTTGDFSTIKSGEFGDNIVSETLVDILVKQGKKDKAVEVLKKLIWKYPQKKAYFAAQIEELKK